MKLKFLIATLAFVSSTTLFAASYTYNFDGNLCNAFIEYDVVAGDLVISSTTYNNDRCGELYGSEGHEVRMKTALKATLPNR